MKEKTSLLAKVEEIYKNSFFDEKIVKESDKLPLKVKQSLESINDINEIREKENELNSEINYYIEFENNLDKIDEINKIINKCNSNKTKLSFEYNINELENIIKKFGDVKKYIKDDNIIGTKFEKKSIEKILYGSLLRTSTVL